MQVTYDAIKEENDHNKELKIFFNQDNNTISILSECDIIEAKLISITGNILITYDGYDIESLKVPNLESGIYILTCEDINNTIRTLKLHLR